MGLFGWSLPPGCGTLPGEEPAYCEVCGLDTDDCVCHECPVCGDFGNPECYAHHGMQLTEAQEEARVKVAAQIEADKAEWNAYAEEINACKEQAYD
jgi:hypothetical protein